MPRPDSSLVATLKGALSDRARAVPATIEALPTCAPEVIDALHRAAKGSRGRADTLASVWLALGEGGDRAWAAAGDAAVRAILAEPASPERDGLVQRLAFAPARLRFAPELRAIVADRADPAWAFAVMTVGQLRDGGAVDALMTHAAGLDTPFVVLVALVHLRDPVAALAFEPNLAHPEPRTRTFALWGLAALGYSTPLAALVDLLDDPDDEGPGHYTPGQSLRAAQALCDVHGWPFEWSASAVAPTRARCAERYDASWLARCRVALAAGHLDLRDE